MVNKLSLGFVGFLQATGIFAYCFLVSLFLLNVNSWFGPVPNIVGPVAFLILFILSAVTCSLIFLGYPFILFWENKQTKKAVRLVIYSTAWLFSYLVGIFLSYFFLK